MALTSQLVTYRALRLQGKSRYRAAIDSGYSVNMALRASRLDEAVAGSLQEILAKEGMDNKFIADQIKAGLGAMRIIVDKNGTIHENPDMFIRHKYLDTLLDITGNKNRKPSGIDGDVPVNLPQLIVQTLNITVDKRSIVDVVR